MGAAEIFGQTITFQSFGYPPVVGFQLDAAPASGAASITTQDMIEGPATVVFSGDPAEGQVWSLIVDGTAYSFTVPEKAI